ncbi:MAG: hypothetical protein L0027_04860 [Candidatus Rokubacteria bacterium]|nr:hypothetical protein [Candidatus Rokubacteria bacterium]
MAVTALEITARGPVLEGRPVGDTGAYEKIAGVLRGAIDPAHVRHALIADLAHAPRAAGGLVEYAADFYLLRPVDPARGNRCLLLDVPNRGRKLALAMFNSAVRVADPSAPEDFGNGFLMRHGYTVAWVGWQHDVPRVDADAGGARRARRSAAIDRRALPLPRPLPESNAPRPRRGGEVAPPP